MKRLKEFLYTTMAMCCMLALAPSMVLAQDPPEAIAIDNDVIGFDVKGTVDNFATYIGTVLGTVFVLGLVILAIWKVKKYANKAS